MKNVKFFMNQQNVKHTLPDSPPHVPLDTSSSSLHSDTTESNHLINTKEIQIEQSQELSPLKISILETPQKYFTKKPKNKIHFGKSRPPTQQNGPGESTPNSPTEQTKTIRKMNSINDLSTTPDVNILKYKSKPKSLQSLIFDAILTFTTEDSKYVHLDKISQYVGEHSEESEKENLPRLIIKTLSKMVNKKYLKIKNLSSFKLTKEGKILAQT